MLTFLRGTFGPENSDTENSYADSSLLYFSYIFFFFSSTEGVKRHSVTITGFIEI